MNEFEWAWKTKIYCKFKNKQEKYRNLSWARSGRGWIYINRVTSIRDSASPLFKDEGGFPCHIFAIRQLITRTGIGPLHSSGLASSLVMKTPRNIPNIILKRIMLCYCPSTQADGGYCMDPGDLPTERGIMQFLVYDKLNIEH
jgi:hypothetical protein